VVGAPMRAVKNSVLELMMNNNVLELAMIEVKIETQ